MVMASPLRSSLWACLALLLAFPVQAAQPTPSPDAGSPDAGTIACPRSKDLRVLTYNIRLDTAADGANRWSNRKGLLVSQLELLAPAIAGFQEVLPNQLADLEAAMPGFARIGGGRDDGAGKGEAAPLFVDRRRFKILGGGTFWLSPTPDRPSRGWDAAYPRIASWARLIGRGERLSVLAINTHWDHEGSQARLESARQLASWIAANRRRNERLVLLGDFNAPLTEASLASLTGPSGASLSDSRTAARAKAHGNTATFNGFSPIPAAGAAIDHILFGGGLEARRHHVLGEQFDGRVASDHFPVIADLGPAAKACW